jgi:hypothetical protein
VLGILKALKRIIPAGKSTREGRYLKNIRYDNMQNMIIEGLYRSSPTQKSENRARFCLYFVQNKEFKC